LPPRKNKGETTIAPGVFEKIKSEETDSDTVSPPELKKPAIGPVNGLLPFSLPGNAGQEWNRYRVHDQNHGRFSATNPTGQVA